MPTAVKAARVAGERNLLTAHVQYHSSLAKLVTPHQPQVQTVLRRRRRRQHLVRSAWDNTHQYPSML